MRVSIGIAFSSLFVFAGCVGSELGATSTITGSGINHEEKREVAPFQQIDIAETFEVTVTIGDVPSITLNVDDNLLKYVETRVDQDRLELKFTEGPIFVTSRPQKVMIVVPKLEAITTRGAAKVVAPALEGKALRIEAMGASVVEISGFSFDDVEVKAEGAGRVSLAGKGKVLAVKTSGASKLWAADATFESVKVAIEGVARGEVNLTGSIDGHLSGASSLNVRGNPPSRTVKATGAARITY